MRVPAIPSRGTAVAVMALLLAACGPRPDRAMAREAAASRPSVATTAGSVSSTAAAGDVQRLADARDMPPPRVEPGLRDDADQGPDKVRDAAISSRVSGELSRDRELAALGIKVDTQAGRVTLDGHVPSAAARERATRLAGQVDGVRTVENRLLLDDTRPAASR